MKFLGHLVLPRLRATMLHENQTPMPSQAIGASRSAHFRRVSPSATVGPHLHNVGRDQRNASDAARQRKPVNCIFQPERSLTLKKTMEGCRLSTHQSRYANACPLDCRSCILEALAVPAPPTLTSCRGADVMAAERPSPDLLGWICAGVKTLILKVHINLTCCMCLTV